MHIEMIPAPQWWVLNAEGEIEFGPYLTEEEAAAAIESVPREGGE